MAAQLKPGGGRSHLRAVDLGRARTRPCVGAQSRGRTSQSPISGCASPREAVAWSARARRCRNSSNREEIGALEPAPARSQERQRGGACCPPRVTRSASTIGGVAPLRPAFRAGGVLGTRYCAGSELRLVRPIGSDSCQAEESGDEERGRGDNERGGGPVNAVGDGFRAAGAQDDRAIGDWDC